MFNIQLIKNFLRYFLPISLSILIISGVLYQVIIDNELNTLKKREVDNIALIKSSFEYEFESVISDLMELAENDQLIGFLDNQNKILSNIKETFKKKCKWKKTYDQIRFIDSEGLEIVRINNNNEDCEIVPDSDLQDKNNRYYFQETINQQKGNIYVSPFDLNIENGQVEIPYKPMIRFCTPVYNSSNIKKGIIVINYLGDKILNRIHELSNGMSGELHIVNPKGYWLHSPIESDEWGFMFANGTEKKYSNLYHQSWEIINAKNHGQFITKNGYFTYETFNPTEKMETEEYAFISKDKWKIISYVSSDMIHFSSNSILKNYIYYNVFILLTIFGASVLLARARLRKQIHEASLKEKERLQGVLEMAGAVSHEISQPLQIITTYIDLLNHDQNSDVNNPKMEKVLNKINTQVSRIGEISKKLNRITKYETRDYIQGVRIVDIDKSTEIKD